MLRHAGATMVPLVPPSARVFNGREYLLEKALFADYAPTMSTFCSCMPSMP